VIEISAELDVTRGAVNRWLQWYEAMGTCGLRTGKAPGPAPKLTDEQRRELSAVDGQALT
jgi:transposase